MVPDRLQGCEMPNDKLKDAPADHRMPAGTSEGTPREDKPCRFTRFRGHAGEDLTTEVLMELTRGEWLA